MKKIFFTLACFGLIIGLIIHLSTFIDIGIDGTIKDFWPLHVGIFIVFLPAVLEARSEKALFENVFKEKKNISQFYKILFKNAPRWITYMGIFSLIYAVINFGLFMVSALEGMSEIMDGKYVLANHGEVVRELTEQEFNHYQSLKLRGFSGHWILFYTCSMGILYPKSWKFI